ncbi:hypothetical protein T4B_9049 [Trichinella pseudospiralis]|uniref:Uncharacterized protein n=1 Tax=Trichinella pseudospiralis TaxID=6337 RepID=A0A0V1JYW6_TRIPS|nr:hypothetical protein T4A_13234 [Trichinella pseudospiralis]KRZ25214.1 hypothetical protein T4B_9049 [Trichinella pseudospiralis]KRZ40199.1 hypothetical protein T4C_4939 [Trichinella pseudospiralis]
MYMYSPDVRTVTMRESNETLNPGTEKMDSWSQRRKGHYGTQIMLKQQTKSFAKKVGLEGYEQKNE